MKQMWNLNAFPRTSLDSDESWVKCLLAKRLPSKGHGVVYELTKKSEDLEANQGLFFITFNLHPTAIISAISKTFIIIKRSFFKSWVVSFCPLAWRGVLLIYRHFTKCYIQTKLDIWNLIFKKSQEIKAVVTGWYEFKIKVGGGDAQPKDGHKYLQACKKLMVLLMTPKTIDTWCSRESGAWI